MSVWVTEEVMRWALRFCSRRYPWQQHRFPLTTSIKDTYLNRQQLVQVCVSQKSQTSLSKSLISSVRFYSLDRSHRDGVEESSLPPEVQQEDSAPDQRQIWSPFYDKLEGCGSPSDVLDLPSQFALSARQVSNCLNHMWSTTKRMSEEQRRYELQLMFAHPAFEELLQKALKAAGHMRNDTLTYSLLSMVNLGVSQRSRVVQTYLRICQENLNDFDEKCLSILASCLEHMERSPNVDALKEGMRLIVDARLPQIKNVMALQTMMRLLGKDGPLDLKRRLEKKALSMADQFSLPNTLHMITTMATMGFYSKPLMDLCSKKITNDFHGIPFNRLYRILVSYKELHYRNADLLTGLSEYVASTLDIWTNKQVLLFLTMFEELAFCPDALMEAYADKVISNPDVLILKDISSILKVYSSLNYDLRHQRQQFLDSLSHALSSYLPKMPAFMVLKAVYYLCLLGHFPSAPLEQLLHSSTLEQLDGSKFVKSRDRMFQMIDSCLRLDRPPLPQPLTVPTSMIGDTGHRSQKVNVRLSEGLQSLMGDEARAKLEEMVVVENLYLIDGLITKPLPIESCQTEESSCAGVEGSPAESSQRIAVIYTPQSGFCYGTSKPRGLLAVKIRHLKILGYTPVLVTDQELQCDKVRTETLRARIFPELHTSETQTAVEADGILT